MSSRQVVVIVIVLVLLTNVALIWRRGINREQLPEQVSESWAKRAETQSRLIEDWASSETVPLRQLLLTPHMPGMAKRKCLGSDTQGSDVAYESLTEPQQQDLAVAIEELAKAYGANSPEQVYAYMVARGKMLAAESRHDAEEFLQTTGGYDRNAVREMSDSELYSWYWRLGNSTTYWESLVTEDSCISIWRSQSINEQNLEDANVLATHDFSTWRNKIVWRHNFVPPPDATLDVTSAEHDGLLIADVKLIIEHNSDAYGERAPYLLRLWYNPKPEKWQPLLLVRTTVVADVRPTLLF